jgi:hypothetical protein
VGCPRGRWRSPASCQDAGDRQTSGGYIALGPVATATPSTSTLNFPTGDDRATGVTVTLGAGGTLSAVFKGAAGATTALVFDVTGYFR